jgi:hypothetical protein
MSFLLCCFCHRLLLSFTTQSFIRARVCAHTHTLSLSLDSLSFALCGGFGAPRWVKWSQDLQKLKRKCAYGIHTHFQVCSVCHPPNMFLTSKFNYLLFFPNPSFIKLKLGLQIGRRLLTPTFTLRSVSSLNNLQNCEMKFSENRKLTC